jgi:hypothetical protein
MDYLYIIVAILNLVILPLSVYYELDYLRNTVILLDILILIYIATTKKERKTYSIDEVRNEVEKIIGQ